MQQRYLQLRLKVVNAITAFEFQQLCLRVLKLILRLLYPVFQLRAVVHRAV